MISMYFTFYCLLIFVAVTEATAENTSTVKEVNIPIPSIYGISDFSDEGPIVLWLLDKTPDVEPVLGYKVKLWQVGCSKKAKYKIVNGERVRQKNVMPRLRDYSTLRNLTETVLEGANHGELLLKDIEPDVPYHMTVAATTAAGDGPPSNPFRFQYRGRYTCREI